MDGNVEEKRENSKSTEREKQSLAVGFSSTSLARSVMQYATYIRMEPRASNKFLLIATVALENFSKPGLEDSQGYINAQHHPKASQQQ